MSRAGFLDRPRLLARRIEVKNVKRHSVSLLVALALTAAARTFAAGEEAISDSAGPAAVPWRAWGVPAFREARAAGLPVFLVLTAPWNWDHFLLSRELFSSPEIRAAITESCVPVRADASLYPELVELYEPPSGLVPSFHFLDANGRSLGTFPPLGAEELVYYLGEMRDPASRSLPQKLSPQPTIEVATEHFADRLIRLTLARLEESEDAVVPLHRDVDPAPLAFLIETHFGRGRRDLRVAIERALRGLLRGALHDREEGGFHRSLASRTPPVAHFEKTLRTNAELAAVFVHSYLIFEDEDFGETSLLTLRFLNERLRTRGTTLYAGSLAADVYATPAASRIAVPGRAYYRRTAEERRHLGRPPRSEDVPVGANFVLHRALASTYRAFQDERMRSAVRRGGALLLEGGFEKDGLARRELGVPGVGNLRDQGDAGSGLLAYHGLTGDPRALGAAIRLGEALRQEFLAADGATFHSVGCAAGCPAAVRDAPPFAGWNGVALRFLSELAVVTAEERWRSLVEESLRTWASRLPASGQGVAELGRAALRIETGQPLVLIVADPESKRGRELRDLVFLFRDPLLLVRWLPLNGAGEAASPFGIEVDREPALYLIWEGSEGPIRDASTLQRRYALAARRVRGF
jgi:uncharacterized protein YyaL (SSP411 family)